MTMPSFDWIGEMIGWIVLAFLVGLIIACAVAGKIK